MPSQKQRRRRQKENRHVYVFVDDDGNEIEPEQLRKPAADKKVTATRGGSKGGRPVRPIPPPTWKRAGKWAAGLSVGTFVLLAAGNGNAASAAPVALLYAVLSVPMIYAMHRFQYRAYVRMAEKRGQKIAP
jgi:hypothetical protein